MLALILEKLIIIKGMYLLSLHIYFSVIILIQEKP